MRHGQGTLFCPKPCKNTKCHLILIVIGNINRKINLGSVSVTKIISISTGRSAARL